MAITLKQLADELDLDHSTVAYALSGKGRIAAETRKRVIETANRLGYVPNRLARNMRMRRTNTIGLILTDVVYSPYSEVVQNLLKQAADRGRELLIALHQFDSNLEEAGVRRMLESQVDGLLIKAIHPTRQQLPAEHPLQQVIERKIPVLTYYTCAEQSLGLPSIDDPRVRGFGMALEHLASLGHKRIAALLPVAQPLRDLAMLMKQTADEVCARSGIAMDMVCVASPKAGSLPDYISQHSPAYALSLGRELFARAMELPSRPTAMVGFNDVIATGAVMAALERGLKVPEQIAISGCYRLPVSFFSPVPLTTCDTRPADYAKEMLDLLEQCIENPVRPVEHRRFEPILVPGASTMKS